MSLYLTCEYIRGIKWPNLHFIRDSMCFLSHMTQWYLTFDLGVDILGSGHREE